MSSIVGGYKNSMKNTNYSGMLGGQQNSISGAISNAIYSAIIGGNNTGACFCIDDLIFF